MEIFIDQKQAFDAIDYKMLIYKMESERGNIYLVKVILIVENNMYKHVNLNINVLYHSCGVPRRSAGSQFI